MLPAPRAVARGCSSGASTGDTKTAILGAAAAVAVAAVGCGSSSSAVPTSLIVQPMLLAKAKSEAVRDEMPVQGTLSTGTVAPNASCVVVAAVVVAVHTSIQDQYMHCTHECKVIMMYVVSLQQCSTSNCYHSLTVFKCSSSSTDVHSFIEYELVMHTRYSHNRVHAASAGLC
jgi:hypothetical protein